MTKKNMAQRVRKPQSAASRLRTVEHHRRKALPVTDGLQSPETVRQYDWHFKTFKKWMSSRYSKEITDDDFLEFALKRETLELDIIDYLKHLRKGLKRSSVASSMAAIIHFCRVNGIWLNRERISLFVPKDENRHKDREYTRDEIQKLIDLSDQRFKVVFLLLTNGLRIGAIPELNIGHLKAWPLPTNDPEPPKVYQIKVYEGSKSEHYTFLTPEATEAIDEYLDFRRTKAHEDITKADSPLIREQFPLYNQPAADDDVAIPKRMSKSSLVKTIQRILKKAGLDTIDDDIMLTHGFRKYCVTMLKKANVDWSDREFLVGHRHSRGLDVQYDKTSEEDRLYEWSKAINLLTIKNKSYHIDKELQRYKDEYARRFDEQSQMIAQQAKEIERLRKGFLDYGKLVEEGEEQIKKRTQNMEEYLERRMKQLGIKEIQ